MENDPTEHCQGIRNVLNQLESQGVLCCDVKTTKQAEAIYDRWILHPEPHEEIPTEDGVINFYYGLFHLLFGDSEQGIRYLEKAQETGKTDQVVGYSAYNIGKYYQNQHQYELAKKGTPKQDSESAKPDRSRMKHAYETAIARGVVRAMNDLAFHYQHVEIDEVEMIRYYTMAIELKHTQSMYNLGIYYYQKGSASSEKKINSAIDEAKRYLMLATEHGHVDSMNALGTIFSYEGKTELTEQYYIAAAKQGHPSAIHNLVDYYQANGLSWRIKQAWQQINPR